MRIVVRLFRGFVGFYGSGDAASLFYFGLVGFPTEVFLFPTRYFSISQATPKPFTISAMNRLKYVIQLSLLVGITLIANAQEAAYIGGWKHS